MCCLEQDGCEGQQLWYCCYLQGSGGAASIVSQADSCLNETQVQMLPNYQSLLLS